MNATKHDDGKNPLDLLPVPALLAVGEVLKHGRDKYGAYNWAKGMRWSRLFGAALRHAFADWNGEDFDEETNQYHIAHAACCLLFYLTYKIKGWGEDDRHKGYSGRSAAPATGGGAAPGLGAPSVPGGAGAPAVVRVEMTPEGLMEVLEDGTTRLRSKRKL